MKLGKTSGLLKIIVIIGAVYLAANLVALQLQLSEAEESAEALERRIALQHQENERMKAELGEELGDDYVIDAARDELELVMPGERVFIDVSH